MNTAYLQCCDLDETESAASKGIVKIHKTPGRSPEHESYREDVAKDDFSYYQMNGKVSNPSQAI
jgi:hypothetical protein